LIESPLFLFPPISDDSILNTNYLATQFRLIFKIFGADIGIEINTVDQMGAEGIVNFAKIWFADELPVLSATGSKAVREYPASMMAVFCQ
jgi:hypothetical protein